MGFSGLIFLAKFLRPRVKGFFMLGGGGPIRECDPSGAVGGALSSNAGFGFGTEFRRE